VTTKSATGFVYTLSDPRDGTIRYVGKTTGALLDRLAGHLASPTNPAMRVWLNALSLQGVTPHITAVATVPKEKLAAEEDRLIRQHAKNGHRLLNAPYYHRNLTDLIGAKSTQAPPPPRERAAHRQQQDRIAEHMYGSLASRRAAGQTSRWVVVPYVMCSAPLYLTASIAVSLWRHRWVRAAVGTVAVGYYLWSVGFDHAARDYVLPHLPVAEAAEFWQEYLAEPMQTIGLHLLAVSPVGAAAAYQQLALAAGVGKAAAAPTSSTEVAARAAAALDAALPKPKRPAD
jgi:hypothetical protein